MNNRMEVLVMDVSEGSVAIYNEIIYLGYRRQSSSQSKQNKQSKLLIKDFVETNMIISYYPFQHDITIFDFTNFTNYSISVPKSVIPTGISQLFLHSRSSFLLFDQENQIYSLDFDVNLSNYQIKSLSRTVQANPPNLIDFNYVSAEEKANEFYLTSANYLFHKNLKEKNSANDFAIYSYDRNLDSEKIIKKMENFYLAKLGILINLIYLIPNKNNKNYHEILLEIIYTNDNYYKIINLNISNYFAGNGSLNDFMNEFSIRLGPLDDGKLFVLQSDGTMRIFELLEEQLSRSLSSWIELIGNSQADGELTLQMDGVELSQLNRNGQSGSSGDSTDENEPPEALNPKEGQENDGKDHHGGNNWQGGTGGSETVFSPFHFIAPSSLLPLLPSPLPFLFSPFLPPSPPFPPLYFPYPVLPCPSRTPLQAFIPFSLSFSIPKPFSPIVPFLHRFSFLFSSSSAFLLFFCIFLFLLRIKWEIKGRTGRQRRTVQESK